MRAADLSQKDLSWLKLQCEKLPQELRQHIFEFYSGLYQILFLYILPQSECKICKKPIATNFRTYIYSACEECVDSNLTIPTAIVEFILLSNSADEDYSDFDYDKIIFLNREMIENTMMLFGLNKEIILNMVRNVNEEKDPVERFRMISELYKKPFQVFQGEVN
jgi:hypothetical protein